MSPLIIDELTNGRSPLRKRARFAVTSAKLQDVRRLVDIEFHAFENEQVNQVLSYRDYKKPAHFERTVKIYQRTISQEEAATPRYQQGKKHSPRVRLDVHWPISRVSFRKVVDRASNEIVSFTKYEMKAYTEAELHEPADIGHEGEPMMNRDWFALNERVRREYIGMAKHCYIGMLATEPKHQHNGAGTMLLEEILAEADDAGIEVYLEATDTAKPLYEKHGFEAITELRFAPADYGVKGLGTESQTVMVRGALGSDGVRRTVRPWSVAVADAKAELQV